ncbi:MAG: hypothetical protein AAGK78_06440, partial [Planctomycetota bacterium]
AAFLAAQAALGADHALETALDLTEIISKRAAFEAEAMRVMVIGQRFNWHVVEPGPDGKLGRYLQTVRPTDAHWPVPPEEDPATYTFRGTRGPAELPAERRTSYIEAYRQIVNPLGKDFADPAGLDDVWRSSASRPLRAIAGTPVEVQLGSIDVIHDFNVPAMRVKQDAVPGLWGTVRFTPTDAGEYTILCAEFCGWGHYTMQSRLIVDKAVR